MRVIAPFLSCVVNMQLTEEDPDELQQAIQEGYSEIYVITPNGIVKHHRLRGEGRYLQLKVDSIPNFPMKNLTETICFLPNGKVPYEIFEQVEAFFRKVMEVKNSDVEAMIFVLWNAEQGYHLFVPNQRISKASVSYDWDTIPDGSSIVVDVHSH